MPVRRAADAVTADHADPVSHQPGPKHRAVALGRAAAASEPEPECESASPGTSFLQTPEPEIAISLIEVLTGLLGLAPAPRAGANRGRANLPRRLPQKAAGGGSGSARGLPVLPPNAPLRPAMRLWLDGVLTRLFSRAAVGGAADGVAPAAPAGVRQGITVLWASQTGRAEELAGRMAARVAGLGHAVRACSMPDCP